MPLPPDVTAILTAWAREMGTSEDAIVTDLVRLAVLTARMHRVTPLLQELRATIAPRATWGTMAALLLQIVDGRSEGWSPQQVVLEARESHGLRLKSRSVAGTLGLLVTQGRLVRLRHGVFSQ